METCFFAETSINNYSDIVFESFFASTVRNSLAVPRPLDSIGRLEFISGYTVSHGGRRSGLERVCELEIEQSLV